MAEQPRITSSTHHPHATGIGRLGVIRATPPGRDEPSSPLEAETVATTASKSVKHNLQPSSRQPLLRPPQRVTQIRADGEMESNFAIFSFIPLDDEILFVLFSFCFFFFFTFFFGPPVERHLTAISPEWSVKQLSSSSSSKNLTLTFSTETALSPLMQAELLILWEPILRP
ncbi:unnamed protein product [Gadus morhua 'NCC']